MKDCDVPYHSSQSPHGHIWPFSHLLDPNVKTHREEKEGRRKDGRRRERKTDVKQRRLEEE